jgi:enoyl-CoA hydratase/carnithine racemase
VSAEFLQSPSEGVGLSPIAIPVCTEAINQAAQSSLGAGLAYEVMAEALCFSSEDSSEGIQAFLDKWTPQFKGSEKCTPCLDRN